MPPKRPKYQTRRPIESYDHRDKQRLNNPPAGLVTPQTDREAGRRTYAYDPHLDPQLQWAGKAEHTSFEVPTVSLHVHERIDPRTIIQAARRRNGNGGIPQKSLFELPDENPPVRSAIEFYKHPHNWTNRLAAGDSLLVMNSLLEKEGMAGKVQMVYVDPPYGIRYGSNFQPFVNKRNVTDRRDEDLTQEPETIKAFRDTWELGIHSYLSYLRDRLLLARDLLTDSGSCFVQISDENVHRVRALMDEVFGVDNFISMIYFATTSGFPTSAISRLGDYLVWYAKSKDNLKYRPLFVEKGSIGSGIESYRHVELLDGTRRPMTKDERQGSSPLPIGSRSFRNSDLQSQGSSSIDTPVRYEGQTFRPLSNSHWKANYPEGIERLKKARRIAVVGNRLVFIRYLNDYPVQQLTNSWMDTGFGYAATDKRYVVQTHQRVIERCILMTTDPGDLVFDPTCGSGTTAYVAEQWGRRWITCDTSRVAISLAKQRLMTASFDYYELAHPNEGVGSGFKYKTVPHVTLGSIANNPDVEEGMTKTDIDAAIARYAPKETIYDQPFVDKAKRRVTGPFSVEAVPAPAVKPIDPIDHLEDTQPTPADAAIARSGETLRQADWRDELLKTGIRGKAGQFIRFARLEPMPGCRYLHADGESRPNDDGPNSIKEGPARASHRIVVSFGPEHAPLEQLQVNHAIQEAQTLVPGPSVIVFAAFQFDPEAAKDIDETNWPGMTLLKAQMNADLLTDDLKRKRASNQSFWLIGQPDVHLQTIPDGEHAGKLQVNVLGFDYYNTKSGDVESGGQDQIAMWMLDTDYDGRSLYPRQVFFPMAGPRDAWARLARNLRAEIDQELIEAYRGTVSLPFLPGKNQRIAVKIIDDRGIESLKVIQTPPAGNSASVGKPALGQILDDMAGSVPAQEWAKLPEDLIDDLDHYTAGADRP